MGKRGPKTNISKHPLYHLWVNLRGRCYTKSNHKYYMYGGRGVRVCKEWDSFEQFVKDMGPRPSPAHSVDRIDTNGNYEPGNCRWATPKQQQRNTRQNVYIEIDGETRVMMDWCMKYGASPSTVKNRVRKMGMSWKEALTAKPNSRARSDSTTGARGIECRGKSWGYRVKINGKIFRSAAFKSKADAMKELNRLRTKAGMDSVC